MPIPVVRKRFAGLYLTSGYLVGVSDGECVYCQYAPTRLTTAGTWTVSRLSDAWIRGLNQPCPVITDDILKNIVHFREPETNNANTSG